MLKEGINRRGQVTIFIIIAGAKVFGKAISLYRIPQELSSFIVTNINEQGLFIFVVCITLLFNLIVFS